MDQFFDVNSNKCRACLTMDPLLLFEWNVDFLENLTYENCFRQCTQLEEFVNEPTMLCYNCASELKCVYDFIQKTKQSDEVLKLKKELNNNRQESPLGVDEWRFECVTMTDADATNFSTSPFHLSNESNDVVDNLLNRPNNKVITADSTSLSADKDRLSKVKCKKRKQAKNTPVKAPKKTRCRGRSRKESDHPDQIDSETFPEKNNLKQLTATESEVHLCHACPRTFKNNAGLQLHAVTHKESRERTCGCDQCGRKFFNKIHLKIHMQTHEPNRRPIHCDQCEKSFSTRGSLNFHMKKHTSAATLQCPICQKGFFRSSHLEIHIRTHSGDTPYKCPYCEKAYSLPAALKYHCMEHTGLPMKCSICGKGFAGKSKMRRHIGNVHKVDGIVEIDKLIIKMKKEKWNAEDALNI